MARVVAEMYRIENVIYIRIKAVGELRPGSTGKLLHYRQRGWLTRPDPIDEHSLCALNPPEPTRV